MIVNEDFLNKLLDWIIEFDAECAYCPIKYISCRGDTSCQELLKLWLKN